MVDYTDRLNLRMVSNDDTMAPNLWNEPLTSIDSLCLARNVIGDITYPAKSSIFTTEIKGSYTVYMVFLKNPGDDEQWEQSSIANFRVYTNADGYIVVQAMGNPPSIDINITLWGLY